MENAEYEAGLREAILHDDSDMEVWEELYTQAVINKAEWTTAYINTLPDEAFAIVIPGGEKDEDGLTTPRDLRKLPHHDATVTDPMDNDSVDWSHLVNALARVNQIDATEEQIAEAQAHLQKHYDEIKAEEEEGS